MSSLRWFGVLALAGAVVMLLIGDLWLKHRLPPWAMLVFWVACFLLTVMAMAVALIELRAIRTTARRAQLNLFQETLEQISHESRQGKGRQETSRDQSPEPPA